MYVYIQYKDEVPEVQKKVDLGDSPTLAASLPEFLNLNQILKEPTDILYNFSMLKPQV